jgi:hypothetical protein
VEDILMRPRILRLLAALREAEPEPLAKAQLMRAIAADYRLAELVINDAREWNLVSVKVVPWGRSEIHEHRLTPEGREIADHALKIATIGQKARQKRR